VRLAEAVAVRLPKNKSPVLGQCSCLLTFCVSPLAPPPPPPLVFPGTVSTVRRARFSFQSTISDGDPLPFASLPKSTPDIGVVHSAVLCDMSRV